MFDVDPSKLGRRVGNTAIRPVAELRDFARREEVSVGIIATPQSAAQSAADHLVAGGIRGILNFAPSALDVPPTVTVRNVNLAIELESLSFALK